MAFASSNSPRLFTLFPSLSLLSSSSPPPPPSPNALLLPSTTTSNPFNSLEVPFRFVFPPSSFFLALHVDLVPF